MCTLKRGLLLSAVLSFSVAALSQAEPSAISKEPLSADQIAIYRVVLEKYVKGKDETLNLADRTARFDPPDPTEDLSDLPPCMKSVDLARASQSHRLGPAIASDLNVVLVDADAQSQIVQQNDPQKLMGTHATDQQLENAVTTAFKTGLFTFSEILFDKPHHHAVVVYSFDCGKMCGHGNLLMLKKVRKRWKVKKVCEGWIS
jgi:hypothetical protein